MKALAKKLLFGLIGLMALLKPWLRHRNPPMHVTVVGDLYSESGLGNVTRALIKTLDGVVDYSVINLPMSVMSKQGDYQFGERETRQIRPGVTIFVGNPSILLSAFLKLNPLEILANKTIGVWFWELEQIPRDWAVAGRLVDEVWAQSAFVAKAFAGARSRVVVMPFVVDALPAQGYDRPHFGIPDKSFVFLMTFDYLSHVARKNPLAVLRAFKAEFADDSSVLLVIKSVNKSRCADAAREVASIIGASSNVLTIDDYLDRYELLSLMQVADCYVSLHRSEGLGLGMAEAMALGTLVVATGYSGNMDFMSADNALLVDYTLKPVKSVEYPYASNNVWAEPLMASAQRQMRVARESGTRTHELIENARQGMAKYDTAHQQGWVANRLREFV